MYRIQVGQGSCGISAGAAKVYASLEREIAAQGLNASLFVTGCNGMCYLEPIVDIYQEDGGLTRLVKVGEAETAAIIEYLRTGDEEAVSACVLSGEDADYLERQTRVAMRNCGSVNPEEIESYIAAGGYSALEKVLKDMAPEAVLEEIKTSGLAGRGGAGFPTWFKWKAARNSESEDGLKYLICNADEGDPGAFMDRAVIESDPHSLLEGMLIGAYVIGAAEAIVYVRAEYPLAIKRLERAIAQAREKGFLGEQLLGTKFSCDLRIQAGAGAFVCGEETALIASLEGKRGMPRLKPPFPAQSGYWRRPSNINNVETFANIPWILQNSGAAFSAMGTETSKGTKVFALTGKIRRGGLAEIPMGQSLRELIFEIGGGIQKDRPLKAVQIGGPSGGCIPTELCDTAIDYQALSELGAIMGSGGLVVMDDSACMVGIARYFLDFTAKESCGKCVSCRIGTKRLLEILDRICAGEGREGDLKLLEHTCLQIKETALCGLGQSAPNPVLTTLRYFRKEYEAHIREHRCPAGECRALIRYEIASKQCASCTLCARDCPAEAIRGKAKRPHRIDQDKCTKCGACKEVCRFDAVVVR